MGELVRRRARAQLGVLAAVLAVMVAGSALVGVCVALTTAAPQRALQLAIVHASAADVQVGVAIGFPDGTDDTAVDARVTATAQDPGAAVAQASSLLTGPFGHLPTTLTTWSSTIMQYLPTGTGPLRLAYLADLDVPDARGTVVDGRWPTAAGEVALPITAAKALGLDVGGSTTLAAEPGGRGAPLTLVGTFVPRPGAAWEEDPLTGTGVSPNYRGFITAYGPFVVAPGALATSDVPFRRVTLRVQPDLAGASADDVARAGVAADALSGKLTSALGDRAQNVVVDLPFARTLDGATRAARRDQLGCPRGGAAGWCAGGDGRPAGCPDGGRPTSAGGGAARRPRSEPRAPGRTGRRGGRGPRRAVHRSVDGARARAVPSPEQRRRPRPGRHPRGRPRAARRGRHRRRAHARRSPGAAVAAHRARACRPRRPGRLVARSGADLLLLAFAVIAFLQLRDHGVATGAVADPVLVVGPVLCLLAGAALALRPLPVLARRADARAAASRSLALPLAAWGVARRPQGTAAAFLVVLATACATFGVGFAATWAQSEREQAAATVGTDLAVAAHVDTLGAGSALRAATGGRVSAVTSRTVTLGSRAQQGDQAVRLVAVDTREADGLLRGRLPSGDWAGTTAGLASSEPVGGVQLTGAQCRSRRLGPRRGRRPDERLPQRRPAGPRRRPCRTACVGVVALDAAPHDLARGRAPGRARRRGRRPARGGGRRAGPRSRRPRPVRRRRDDARRGPLAREAGPPRARRPPTTWSRR